MMAAAIGMIIVALALMIFCVAVMWKVFCKAGEPGWASLIPFYNLYVMTRITWGRGWLFIFGFLPLGNLIFAIFTMIKLAKVFGKKGGFACGLIFLSIVFLPILAFGKAEYTGPDPEKSTGAIIASAITGGIGIILLVLEVIAVVALGLFAVSDLTVQQTQDAVISQEVPEETQEEPDVKEEEDVQREYEGTPIEGYEDFETVSLDGYQWVTDVTLFKDGRIQLRSPQQLPQKMELSSKQVLHFWLRMKRSSRESRQKWKISERHWKVRRESIRILLQVRW